LKYRTSSSALDQLTYISGTTTSDDLEIRQLGSVGSKLGDETNANACANTLAVEYLVACELRNKKQIITA
jgi:hypothetical protein